ncbi:alkaline shock response membrane anchor protein AmaP [Mycolicibacterium sp.]|uniref:alkaline shock response membrane anchor protein AmaP n=1 Tax=Mycolicibacterium sp. TaxID=2320850 RepID=UPI001A33CF2C|nr:alkaline shock response membrane anchor protein AmaP [Mycolicibacterium sp.]MBJ7339806.1 alkaline shock response membrane anchor protein AmaP [Mycolicibacterium sp.]
MTRLAAAVDRFAALVVGIALLALGAGLVLWNTTVLPDVPRTLTAPGLTTAAQTAGWPWALLGIGIVLVVVALRWLLAHTPAAKVKRLPLSGTDAGSITIDLGEVASAAGHALEQSFDVESAGGKAVIDRGTRTVDLTVHVAPTARAHDLVAAIDTACAQVATMLADPTVATRTTIRVEKKSARRVQ